MSQNLSSEEILKKVIAVLVDLTEDWDLDFDEDGIKGETKLIDELGFESIDIVQLVVDIETTFDKKGLPFEKLFMQDGDYVDEILAQDLANFVEQNLD